MGAFFLQVSLGKFNERFLSGEQLVQQLSRAVNDPIPFHRDFILNIVVPNAGTFAHIVAFGELAIAISFLLGILVRVSAAFAFFNNLNIYLAIAVIGGGAQAGLNLIYMALEIAFVLASPGRVLGIDALLKRRFPGSPFF